MESLPEDAILKFHPDTLQAVRKLFSLDTPGEMDEAIDILDAWVKQQNHFVKKDFSRSYLERMIINCKGSVERSKSRLDKLCTMRTLIPQFFGNFDVRKDFAEVARSDIFYIPLPKLTGEHERIFFVKNACKNCCTEVLLDSFKLCALTCEYLKAHDYAASYRFVVDMRELNVTDYMLKVGMMDCRNLITLITEGYGIRISGIHLLSNMKILDAFVAFLRQMMSAKIGGRIRVHRTVESLYEVAPKEILPKEYGEGGEDKSVEEFYENWMEVLSSEDFKAYLKDMNMAVTDEKYRQTDTFNDQYLGMPGTFRKITVD